MDRYICAGDLHIKIRPELPLGFQANRYRSLFSFIISKCKEHDAVLLLAGDLLDSVDPRTEEIDLLLNFMHDLSKKGILTIIVSGNHETQSSASGSSRSVLDNLALDRIDNIMYSNGRKTGERLFPYVLSQEHSVVEAYSHHSLAYLLENVDTVEPSSNQVRILLSHIRCTLNKFVKEEVDLEKVCKPYDLAILGDIHMPLDYSDKIVYTNSALNVHFEEEDKITCGILLVEVSESGIKKERISTRCLPALIRHKVSAADVESLALSANDYHLLEVSGTPEELRKIKNKAGAIIKKIPVIAESTMSDEEIRTLIAEAENEEHANGVVEEVCLYVNTLNMPSNRKEGMVAALREAVNG